MQVTYRRVERCTADLDEDEQDRVAAAVLRKRFGLPEDSYIEDGKLMQHVEQHGGCHSWIVARELRPAVGVDLVVLEVLRHLQLKTAERGGAHTHAQALACS